MREWFKDKKGLLKKWQLWLGLGLLLLVLVSSTQDFQAISNNLQGYSSKARFGELHHTYGPHAAKVHAPDDVSYFDERYEAVMYLYTSGVVTGYPDGTFRPFNDVTRAEFVKMLIQSNPRPAWAKPVLGGYQGCFSDVRDQWFAPFVCQAVENGWVKGYRDGTFRPEQKVNRAEATKMILEARGFIPVPTDGPFAFKDVKKINWFAPYAQAAYELDIQIGRNSYFQPERFLTRGDVAELLFDAIKVDPLQQIPAAGVPNPQPLDHNFGVRLETHPEGLRTNEGEYWVEVEVGEKIRFIPELIYSGRLLDLNWEWDLPNNDQLDCYTETPSDPQYFEEHLICEAKRRTKQDMKLIMYPVFPDQYQVEIESNVVQVTVIE